MFNNIQDGAMVWHLTRAEQAGVSEVIQDRGHSPVLGAHRPNPVGELRESATSSEYLSAREFPLHP